MGLRFVAPARIDQYILHQPLNEGGIAEVYLATDPQDKAVAIRRLRPDFKFRLARRAEFRRGMEIQKQMHGPHVARVLELRTLKLLPYAVMEYIEGVNLREALHRREEFVANLPVAYAIFEKIVKGLGEIHRRGYMHLDVKPENLMLNHDGDVKILDFDLSRPIPREPTTLPSVSGTPSYLAPEIILKEPVDERADVFALGIMGYELFTRQKPIVAESQQEVFRTYTSFSTKFPAAMSIQPAILKPLSDILQRAVEKRLEARYPSIQVLLRDLMKIKPSHLQGG